MVNHLTRLAALAALGLLGGCVAKQSGTIDVYQACFPPTPDTTTGACVYPAGKCDTIPLDTFMLDVDLAGDFFLALEVHNNLAANDDADSHHLDTHTAYVSKYSVALSGPGGIPGISGYTESTVPPVGSNLAGVHFVDADSFLALAAAAHASPDVLHYAADVKLSGVWGDQSEFETAPRKFGLDVCAGCLGIVACDAGKTPAACPGFGQEPSAQVCLAAAP